MAHFHPVAPFTAISMLVGFDATSAMPTVVTAIGLDRSNGQTEPQGR